MDFEDLELDERFFAAEGLYYVTVMNDEQWVDELWPRFTKPELKIVTKEVRDGREEITRN